MASQSQIKTIIRKSENHYFRGKTDHRHLQIGALVREKDGLIRVYLCNFFLNEVLTVRISLKHKRTLLPVESATSLNRADN